MNKLIKLSNSGLLTCYRSHWRVSSTAWNNSSFSTNRLHNQTRSNTKDERKVAWTTIAAATVGLAGLGLFWHQNRDKLQTNGWRASLSNAFQAHALESKNIQDQLLEQFGQPKEGLPSYKLSQVAKHRNKDDRIWVAFQNGVYDITEFVDQHPGGDAILMAAGGQLEPFWAIYANHKTEQVLCILESYRIGNLDQDDVIAPGTGDLSLDPFALDPVRHPALKVHTQKPFNAEAPTQLLSKQFLTPNELFFVRNHLPVPEVNLDEYELEISGLGLSKPIVLTYEQLSRMPQHTITTTVQCAGNRRKDMFAIKEVKGLAWTEGAISTATWTGVRLIDLLKEVGVDMNDPRIKHLQADGLDLDPTSKPYGASVPAEIAFDPNSDLLLALKMNDQPIPRDHGFPVRLIVPGVVGARNVKWLSALRLSELESDSHWQQSDYKGFIPQMDYDNVDFKRGFSIQALPVQSAICYPSDGTQIKLSQLKEQGNQLQVSGYAWSGGGRRIIRVDVSTDGGKTWTNAHLYGEQEHQERQKLELQLHEGSISQEEFERRTHELINRPIDQSKGRSWSWILWTLDLNLSEEQLKGGDQLEIICKAVDSQYNVQPERVEPLWNFRGVLNNSWHRIRLHFK